MLNDTYVAGWKNPDLCEKYNIQRIRDDVILLYIGCVMGSQYYD